MMLRRRAVTVFLAVAAAALGSIAPAAAQSGFASGFDHFTTGFALEGAHALADCETCHTGGVFEGTPTECSGCHSQAGRIAATAKPTGHVLSGELCADCHREAAWLPLAQMNHDAIYGGCASCHDNVQGAGKPPGHPLTDAQCDNCHRTVAWLPAGFDHYGIVSDCSGCHNGTTATGKHVGHLATTADCGACHSTVAFLPAGFDHDTVAAGTCSGCHDGTTATGKPMGHFGTNLQCDTCHLRTAWTPFQFVHTTAAYPGDHAGNLGCAECHSSNTETVLWPFPAYAPDCAGCHAGDYRPDPHRNASVSELRNCAGSCHQQSPEHRVNAREW